MSKPTKEDLLLPLTDAQKQLWILAQLENENSIAYNQSISVQMRGSLNLSAMQRAVYKVVDRHEALRIRILPSGERQQVLPVLNLELPLLDFSNLDSSEANLKAADWFDKESRNIFQVNEGPLWRIQVLKLEEELHWLVLSAHHIGLDFRSMLLILQDLGVWYSAECQGQTCQLQEPKQFQEYKLLRS